MTVLVPIDGSSLAERALGIGRRVADARGTDLMVVTVVADSSAAQRRIDGVRAATEHFAEPVTDILVIQSDDPAAVISREAAARDADICMSTHGHSGFARALLGSVTESVIRSAVRPVLLIGPKCEADVDPTKGTMVIPTDGSTVADHVAGPASMWLAGHDMRGLVVTVVDEPQSPSRASTIVENDVSEAASATRLARKIAEQSGQDCTWESLHGRRAADAIVEFLSHTDATLVVVATHGRSGVNRVAIGSQAMALVHGSPVPVLVHRPTRYLKV